MLLVWLHWPEECFRANDDDIAYLRTLFAGEVICVSDERSFVEALPGATHVITWHFRKEWYALAPNLRMLSTPAAGRELIAWQQAPQGVKVHFGAFHGAIIAESVAAFCLGWARGFFRRPPESGIWPREWLGDKCFMLEGTKAVIAGYGRIGKAIGAKLASLGVAVQGFSRANIDGLEPAMREADWFILALPGDTGTDDFLDERRIALLPRRCAVVNIGRGNAIDEAALYAALDEGRIAAAYLDVFKREGLAIWDNTTPGTNPKAQSTKHQAQSTRHQAPATLIPMPHASAFSPDYLRRCFRELHDEGFLQS